MARILVTGGAGFIGSNLVDTYLALGHDVAVVDNFWAGKRENLNPKARFYEVDVRTPALAEVFEKEKPEVVNHLAAQIDVRKSLDEPIFDAEVNILGGISLLELCIKHKVNKFIFASTGGAIYGEPKELPATENCPPSPKCHYAASKLAFEFYLKLYYNLYGMRYTILRYPNVYGPRQSPSGEAGVCSILTGIMLAGKTPTLYGFGKAERDYVFVGDVARANVMALEKGDGEIVNLGWGHGVAVREVFDALAEIIGFKEEPNLAPLRAGEIERCFISGAKATEVLGWKPETTLREGLAQVVAHIRAHS